MNRNLTLAAATVALVAFLWTFNRDALFAPPTIPGSHGHLRSAKIIHVTGAIGPESLAFDPNGEGPYTGVADGRILKWQGDEIGWANFAHTSSNRTKCSRPYAPELEHVCGRPLGLRFHKKTGDLYIADAYFGLLVVGPTGGLATPLVTEVGGKPLRFTNDLDIDEQEDAIYFTDTSTNFQRRQFMSSILNEDRTGRLLKYDMSSKEVTVLLQGLAFANGVALGKDRSFVLTTETGTCSVARFWLSGPKAGKVDVFAELPGSPDNIRRNSKGEFWVALHAKKALHAKRGIQKLFAKIVMENLGIEKALLKLPLDFKLSVHSLLVGGPHATAIKLSEDGKVLEVLEDSKGKTMRFISEVEEKDGKLWMGSVLMPFIGVHDL